jgi:hypothetical protein
MTFKANARLRVGKWTAPVPAGSRPLIMLDAGPGVGWGVLRRNLANHTNDLRAYTHQKLTHGRGPGYLGAWQIDATHAVFLPEEAPADLLDAQRLVERYEADSFDTIRDLACVVKIAIPDPADVVKQWKRIRRFAEYQFVQRDMACIAILHQPWRSGVKADAHVHLIAPARELGRDGFGAFVRPFATDAGAAEIYTAWSNWR